MSTNESRLQVVSDCVTHTENVTVFIYMCNYVKSRVKVNLKGT